ncbi:hypothetical protein K438DRAFT_1780701 [Mycena galopus ATCC 62051]|nr:hypothetical protein K438DRAFT_1780701 [Mycena galopus ATCC 62051]
MNSIDHAQNLALTAVRVGTSLRNGIDKIDIGWFNVASGDGVEPYRGHLNIGGTGGAECKYLWLVGEWPLISQPFFGASGSRWGWYGAKGNYSHSHGENYSVPGKNTTSTYGASSADLTTGRQGDRNACHGDKSQSEGASGYVYSQLPSTSLRWVREGEYEKGRIFAEGNDMSVAGTSAKTVPRMRKKEPYRRPRSTKKPLDAAHRQQRSPLPNLLLLRCPDSSEPALGCNGA